MNTVLVTGGLGFIGSHTCVELLNRGSKVVIVDNLSNTRLEVKEQIEKIAGKETIFINEDLVNLKAVEAIFENHAIDSIIHFAA